MHSASRALHKDIHAGHDQDLSAVLALLLKRRPWHKAAEMPISTLPHKGMLPFSLFLLHRKKKARMPAVALGLGTGNHGAFVEDSGFVNV